MSEPKSFLGVMVSSTFTDLSEHRKALIDLILAHKLLPIEMEHQGAPRGDLDVLDSSLEKVRDAAAYICIISHRYGEVPPSAERNPDRLSITELEFNAAQGKPILLFLMGEDHPVTRKDVEQDPGKLAKLKAFRERAKIWQEGGGVKRVYKEFNSLEEFTKTAGPAIADLKALLASRQDESARSRESAPRESGYRWPQALDFEVYMNAKRESFTGRAWLFEEIQEWLASEAGSRALLIKADYGVGKSAFMSEYVGRFRGQGVISWHFCRHDRPETLQAGKFVRSFAAQLAKVIPEYRQSIESSPELQEALNEAHSRPGSAIEAVVLAPLAESPKPGGPRLLVVDALDESLDGSGSAGLVELLADAAQYFPPWLRLLATSRPVPEVLGPLQTGFRPHQIVADDAPNLEDLRHYVRAAAPRKGIQERLEAEGRSAEFLANLLCDRSGGKFLFVRHALRELADGTLSIAMLEEMPPEGMDAFYRMSYRRRFGNKAENYGEARAVLGVMCAAHEPLSALELAQILEISEHQVRAVQEQIPDFIKLRAEGPRSVLTFEHLSLKEWLTLRKAGRPRATDFAVDPAEASARIHSWALARVAAGDAHTSPYLLRRLATHLDNEDKQSVFAHLLLKCFEWSQAQLDLNGLRGLLEDVEHLGPHPEAPGLRALLRQAEPALRDSSAQWPAQLLGRLGVGSWNIGLESLATAAQRWALAHGDAHPALLPLRRSLHWRSALRRQLEGKDPMVVLPDRRRIAYVRGADVCVCDPASNAEPQRHEGHTDTVRALAVLPDGRVVSGSDDRSVRVWPLDGGAAQVLEGHTDTVSALAVLPDGRVVSGSDDKSVRVWRLERGAAQVLQGHTDWVTALAVLPDGRVVSGSADNTVRVWRLEEGASQVLEGHTGWVTALAVLADGRVVSGGRDKRVRVWNLDDGSVEVLEGHTGWVTALAVLPDGRVVSGSKGTSVRVWRLEDGTAQELQGHTRGVSSLAVLPDGRLVSASRDKSVRVWSFEGGAAPFSQAEVLEGHTMPITALAVLADGRVVSASEDNSVRVWSLEGGAAQRLEGHTRGVSSLATLADGRVVSGSWDKSVRVWSVEGGAPQVLEGHTRGVTALAVLSDGRVAAGGWDKSVRVWGPQGGAAQVLEGHTGGVTALAVLPDGRVVSAGRDKSVRVWNLAGGAAQVLEGHTDCVSALAVLADGRVVSGSWDKSVRLWSLQGGAASVLKGHTDRVTALAVLPDGRVVSGSHGTAVRVWSVEGGAAQVLEGHTGPVIALVVFPDGRVVSASYDRSVRVWSLEAGAAQVLEGHTGPVTALALLPDGRLISGSGDNRVRVWSRTFQIEHSFIADSPVTCLAVNPNGVIVTGCEDGTLHMLRSPRRGADRTQGSWPGAQRP